MIVKIVVELHIEAESAEDARDAVNDVLDGGLFQNELNEWFEEHCQDHARPASEPATVRNILCRYKEGP